MIKGRQVKNIDIKENGDQELKQDVVVNNKRDIIKEGSKQKGIVKKKKKTCNLKGCKRKLGAFGGYDCKCGSMYCTKHRLAHDHNCTFDFKKEQREVLLKQNPKIVKSKFEKI
jgi:hypothetical protein